MNLGFAHDLVLLIHRHHAGITLNDALAGGFIVSGMGEDSLAAREVVKSGWLPPEMAINRMLSRQAASILRLETMPRL